MGNQEYFLNNSKGLGRGEVVKKMECTCGEATTPVAVNII